MRHILIKFMILTQRIEEALWSHRVGVVLIGAAALIHQLSSVYSPGPETAAYPVREMLVNSAGGPLRRALSGDLSLRLAEDLALPPTLIASLFLIGLGLLFFALFAAFLRRLPPDRSLTPLILGPFGVLFYVYDPEVLVRKEAFGMIALCFGLFAALSPHPKISRLWLWGAAVLMPIAILCHEVNIIFAGPLLICALWTAQTPAADSTQHKRHIALLSIGASLASGATVVWVLRHTSVDPAAMCAAIGDSHCGHPFAYFKDSAGDARTLVADHFTPVERMRAVLFAAAAALPFAGVRPNGPARHVAFAAVAIVLPILPLYAIALDFNRWTALATINAGTLACTAIVLGRLSYRPFLPAWVVLMYCGSFSAAHYRFELSTNAAMIWAFLAISLGLVQMRRRLRLWLVAQKQPDA